MGGWVGCVCWRLSYLFFQYFFKNLNVIVLYFLSSPEYQYHGGKFEVTDKMKEDFTDAGYILVRSEFECCTVRVCKRDICYGM